MQQTEHYNAIASESHCQTLALCSADDCGALNCCDAALARLDDPDELFSKAS